MGNRYMTAPGRLLSRTQSISLSITLLAIGALFTAMGPICMNYMCHDTLTTLLLTFGILTIIFGLTTFLQVLRTSSL